MDCSVPSPGLSGDFAQGPRVTTTLQSRVFYCQVLFFYFIFSCCHVSCRSLASFFLIIKLRLHNMRIQYSARPGIKKNKRGPK